MIVPSSSLCGMEHATAPVLGPAGEGHLRMCGPVQRNRHICICKRCTVAARGGRFGDNGYRRRAFTPWIPSVHVTQPSLSASVCPVRNNIYAHVLCTNMLRATQKRHAHFNTSRPQRFGPGRAGNRYGQYSPSTNQYRARPDWLTGSRHWSASQR